MVNYQSTNPITISQKGKSVVYDKWIVNSADTQVNPDGSVAITFHFCLSNFSDPSNPQVCPTPGSVVAFGIPDVLTDPDLSNASSAFFGALVNKAIAQGIIS